MPLDEPKKYKKRYLVRKLEEKEAEEEIKDFVPEVEEFPLNPEGNKNRE